MPWWDPKNRNWVVVRVVERPHCSLNSLILLIENKKHFWSFKPREELSVWISKKSRLFYSEVLCLNLAIGDLLIDILVRQSTMRQKTIQLLPQLSDSLNRNKIHFWSFKPGGFGFYMTWRADRRSLVIVRVIHRKCGKRPHCLLNSLIHSIENKIHFWSFNPREAYCLDQ